MSLSSIGQIESDISSWQGAECDPKTKNCGLEQPLRIAKGYERNYTIR